MRKTITAFVPAVLLCQLLWAQYTADTVFTHVTVMPSFGDCAAHESEPAALKQCSDKALVQFISRQLEYPESARENRVEGTVYVNFIVDETGQVQSPSLLMDIGSGCGDAALAVVQAMPKWEPGLQDGHPKKVKLNLPVQFSLRKAGSRFSEQFSITWGDIVGDTVSVEQLRRNLPYSVYVRGPEGDSRYIDELSFAFGRGKKESSAISRGGISEELVAIVEKSKIGGRFTITASIQDGGNFVNVSRTFLVLE